MSHTVIGAGTYLERILANTLAELADQRAKTPIAHLERVAAGMRPPLSLEAALRGTTTSVIAEIKRASPSKGPIAPYARAAEVAGEYINGGATAISVLTDRRFFDGSLDDLQAVAEVAHSGPRSVPVLRKDFVLDPYQIVEGRAFGADAVLLIVAALTDEQLSELLTIAKTYAVSPLVEVHDEAELDRALDVGATLVGINNRDLRSFSVSLATTERLAALAPPSIALVGESGITDRADVERLARAGVHAVLVGETLMRAEDRRAAVTALLA